MADRGHAHPETSWMNDGSIAPTMRSAEVNCDRNSSLFSWTGRDGGNMLAPRPAGHVDSTRPSGDGEGPVVKQLITAIVQALVDRPEQVQIKEVIGEHAHVLELSVAKEDLGKVIGKGGAHASAIRTIMAAASGKEKKRYILEIIEH
jgi:predicted RNA-binding protein YlqC (UPF0109 family)